MAFEALPDDLAELAIRYLDGQLSQEEFTRLNQQLSQDAAARQGFVQLCLQTQAIAETLKSSSMSPVVPARAARRRWLGWSAAALAACLLLAVVAWQWGRGPQVLVRIVELEGRADVVAAEGLVGPAQIGQELRPGQALRTHGDDSTALLAFADQTCVELGGDTQVRLLADGPGKTVRLEEGQVAAEVMPQPAGQPLTLRTWEVSIVVRGTRFSARADRRQTRVEVEEGAVELTRGDGQNTLVQAGMLALAAADQPIQVQALTSLPVRSSGEIKTGYVQGGFAFTPNGMILTEEKGWLEEHDPQSLKVATRLPLADVRLRGLVVAGDRLAALTDVPGQIKVWQAGSGKLIRSLEAGKQVSRIAISPDGQWLAATVKKEKTSPESLQIWSLDTGRLRFSLAPPGGAAESVAFSPNGQLLAAGCEMGSVAVWESRTGKLLQTLNLTAPQRSRVESMAFTPDGRWLAAGGASRLIRFWSTDNWQPGLELTLDRSVYSLAFASQRPWLAVGLDDGWVRLVDWSDGQELAQIRVTTRAVRQVGFSADSQTLAAIGVMYRVKLWRIGDP